MPENRGHPFRRHVLTLYLFTLFSDPVFLQ
jgi:hypothetical protein